MSDPYYGGEIYPDPEERLESRLEALESHLAALVCVTRELVQVERYRAELEQLNLKRHLRSSAVMEPPWKDNTKGA